MRQKEREKKGKMLAYMCVGVYPDVFLPSPASIREKFPFKSMNFPTHIHTNKTHKRKKIKFAKMMAEDERAKPQNRGDNGAMISFKCAFKISSLSRVNIDSIRE